MLLIISILFFIDRGFATFTVSARIEADNYFPLLTPNTVGTEGGAVLTLHGFGMSDKTTTVTVNYEDVEVISANMSQVCMVVVPNVTCILFPKFVRNRTAMSLHYERRHYMLLCCRS